MRSFPKFSNKQSIKNGITKYLFRNSNDILITSLYLKLVITLNVCNNNNSNRSN